jgi:hypothetical protein
MLVILQVVKTKASDVVPQKVEEDHVSGREDIVLSKMR